VVVFGVYFDGVQGWQRESKGEGKQRNIQILSERWRSKKR